MNSKKKKDRLVRKVMAVFYQAMKRPVKVAEDGGCLSRWLWWVNGGGSGGIQLPACGLISH
jgi:hypothetical protein